MANFLEVADMAVTFPFRCEILQKKLDRAVSFKFPIALAAFLNAIVNLLLPFGILLDSVLPPLILLLGVSRNQLANCFVCVKLMNAISSITHKC
jgi:hypothetical protein